MSIYTHLAFLACIAIAAFGMNLSGFAFALILLGIVGSIDLIPIADAANVASILVIFNAWQYGRLHSLRPDWTLMRPILGSSLVGVLAGVALLDWFSGNSIHMLQLVLGVVIIVCAVLLMLQSTPRKEMASRPTTWFFGAISGVLGGLFSTAGPPMVYHLYRQPLDRMVVKQCLLLMFAGNAVLRLILVVSTGHFSRDALFLSLEAVPVVLGVNWLQARYFPPISVTAVRVIVCALLVMSGLSLMASGMKG